MRLRRSPHPLVSIAVLAALALTAAAPAALACQQHPQVECSLQPESPIVRQGDNFSVFFSVTNTATTAPFPPPYNDDAPFEISIQVYEGISDPLGRQCTTAGSMNPVPVDPQFVNVTLDDAQSPHADDPVTHVQEFVVMPTAPADAYWIVVTAVDLNTMRQCTRQICVVAQPDPAAQAFPYAEFITPIQETAGGTTVPFDVVVHRNGYDPSNPDKPLTVRIRAENVSDPVDLFPTSDPDLFGPGRDFTTPQEVMSFTCSPHAPCYVGMDNIFHVSIHDGPTTVWNSSWLLWSGMGRIVVDEAPKAFVDVLSVDDADNDGEFSGCEEGSVTLRLYARNPFHGATIDNAVLDLPLPPGLVPVAWDLHHHDNPLDLVTPPPGDLLANGTVTVSATSFRVDVPSIATRFVGSPPFPDPEVFYDLFEVDLVLDTIPGGIEGLGPLNLGGLSLTGTADGAAVNATSDVIDIPFNPAPPPIEVSAVAAGAQPLLARPDKATYDWDADPSTGATSFNVYRGVLGDLGAPGAATCLAADLAVATVIDGAPAPAGSGWFYVASGETCGVEGPLGADSFGTDRANDAPCP